jgi:hypothetical protein
VIEMGQEERGRQRPVNVVPFVRQDGRTVDQREAYRDAVAIARDLKRAAPEQLITV